LVDNLQGKRQEIDICLFYLLSVVGPIFLCHICIWKFVYYYFWSYLLPIFVRLNLKNLSHLICHSQWLYRDAIGKGIVINIFSPLIRCNHVINMICSILVLLNSALPKLCGSFNDHLSFLF
jgi:hypothetical protein